MASPKVKLLPTPDEHRKATRGYSASVLTRGTSTVVVVNSVCAQNKDLSIKLNKINK